MSVWRISDSSLPCKHAALGIAHKRDVMEAYCDPMFKTEAYLKSYSERIHPIPDESFWPPMNEILPSIILPPDLRRRPGRPSKNRKRVADEGLAREHPLKQKGKRGKDMAKKQKGGPGLSTAGLSGAVLWEHAIFLLFSLLNKVNLETLLSLQIQQLIMHHLMEIRFLRDGQKMLPQKILLQLDNLRREEDL